MDLDLKEKAALITGTSRGIGKVRALALAEEEFRHNMDLMLFGPLQFNREVVPQMGKQDSSRIINPPSIFAQQMGKAPI